MAGYDCILFFDNRANEFPVKDEHNGWARIYGVWVHYLLTYESNYNRLRLPYYAFFGYPENFSKMLWYNCDYTYYIIRDIFPYYQYYWQIEYDVYYNGEDYRLFLDSYLNNSSELLYNFGESPQTWYWDKYSDWIYPSLSRYCCLYPIMRLSGLAIDYLYKRRIEIGKIFKEIVELDNKDKRYPYCELFTATELMAGGFICECLPNHKIGWSENSTMEFYSEKKYMIYDNIFYHPVKDSSFLSAIKNKTGLKWL